MANWDLRLFGSPALESVDGGGVSGRAVQRHRIALLALLARAPGQRLSRDRLIAWLWPEVDADSGRNLLKVSTYAVRKAIGDAALVSTGSDLRLDTSIVRTDVVEFEAALGRGDAEAAVALYHGAFLDGFFLGDAPEFQDWADRERNHLAARYDEAVEALAGAAESRGDAAAAIAWWKTRAAQDPYDSRVALRLMQALEAGGNRAAAIQHAGLHKRLLQEEFGIESAPEVAALARRLQEESKAPASTAAALQSRPAAPAAPSSPAAPSAPVAPPPPAVDPAPIPTRRPRRRGAAALAMLVIVIIAGLVWMTRPRASEPERSIVVLPFVNISPDGDNEFFSDGLTEEIITRLAAIPGLKVISRTSAMHYKGSKLPLRTIAGELDVAHVLEGSVRRSDGRVRISAQLIDAASDQHRWAQNYEYEAPASIRVQEEIARAVAQALEVELGERERRQLVRRGTSDPEAYELYRRGRLLWQTRTRDAHEQAVRFFQRAIERDSSFADPWAALAEVYVTAYQLNLFGLSEAESYGRVQWAAERALALDDESAAAHSAYAHALWWQKNWPGALREFRRALELNPGHAMARSWYSLLLRGMGESEQALQESRRAYELDPFAVVISGNLGWHCSMVGDYDCAIEQHRKTLGISTYANSHVGLAFALAGKRQFDEAIAEMRKAIALAPQRSEFLADLAYVQARAGYTNEARQSLQRAKHQPFEPYNIGRAYAALGEADSALAWLDRASWHWPHRAVIADPALEPLHADPRFAKLAARIRREMRLE